MRKLYTATAGRMIKGNNAYKMFKYMIDNDGATKYDLLTKVLGKTGTKKELRGYYSCYMRGLRNAGMLDYNAKTYKYYPTLEGVQKWIHTSSGILNQKDDEFYREDY